jgi:hypothetical protein
VGLNSETLARIKANVTSNSVQQQQQSNSKLEASSSGKAALSESVAALQRIANSGISPAKAEQTNGQGSPEALDSKQIHYQQISDKILDLDTALKESHPKMPVLLNEIWKTLITYSEQVTLLTEDQIERIVAGLEKQVDVDLAAITVKSASKGTKKSGPVSASDLGF